MSGLVILTSGVYSEIYDAVNLSDINGNVEKSE